MRGFARDNPLSLGFFSIFIAALVGQSVAGLARENEQLLQHRQPTVDYVSYITSSSFLYLRERSSSESKPVGAPHP